MTAFAFLFLFHGALARLFVNEIAPADKGGDWLELFNSGPDAVDVTGYQLMDSEDASLAFALPSGTVLAPGGFLVVRLSDANATALAAHEGEVATKLFQLRAKGESITLKSGAGVVVDRVTFLDDAQNLDGGSLGRVPDGGVQWFVFFNSTSGKSNANGVAVVAAVTRDADWFADSHEKQSPQALYERAFDNESLQKLELIFEAVQWNVSWNSMVALIGEFGGSPNRGGMMPTNDTMLAMMMPPNGTVFGPTMMMNGNGTRMFRPNMTGGGVMGGGGGGAAGGDPSDLIGGEATYVWCTVRYKGRVWRHVGFRWKGNSSLRSAWGQGSFKIGFRLDFDKFEDEFAAVQKQRFFGFGKMTFSSNFQDGTGMRELLMQELHRTMDVPATRGAPVQVWMDRGDGVLTKTGIYTMIEDPGDREGLPRRLFADNGDGNMYKPDSTPARLTTPFNASAVDVSFSGGVDGAADLVDLVAALHSPQRLTEPSLWRTALSRTIDLAVFARWQAVMKATGNWDQYGGSIPFTPPVDTVHMDQLGQQPGAQRHGGALRRARSQRHCRAKLAADGVSA
jgi:hypothetical protein